MTRAAGLHLSFVKSALILWDESALVPHRMRLFHRFTRESLVRYRFG